MDFAPFLNSAKELFFIVAALVSFGVILNFYVKNSGFRESMQGKKQRFQSRSFLQFRNKKKPLRFASANWEGVRESNCFPVVLDEEVWTWRIGLFRCQLKVRKKTFPYLGEMGFYQLGLSAADIEKIMMPIIKKIFSKYRLIFEKIYPIVVHIDREETGTYLTTFSREFDLKMAIMTFLNEVRDFSYRENLSPTLRIFWSEVIMLEVVLPYNREVSQKKKTFESLPSLEVLVEEHVVRFRMWAGYLPEKIPTIHKEKKKFFKKVS